MKEAEHLYGELERAAKHGDAGERTFIRLVQPVIGEAAAKELFDYWKDRYGGDTQDSLTVLGDIAAFITASDEAGALHLDKEDWEKIREIVSDEAEEMDMDDLSRIMASLVSRGALS